MATQTTNLHLTKPDGSEKVNIATINTNMDTIDTYAGTNNASIINLAEDIGVVVNGNKTKSGVTAAVGQYVILKNSTISNRVDGLYTAAKAIPANTAIDASYLTAVSGGGLNALNAKITTHEFGSNTLANIQSAMVTYAGSMSNYQSKPIAFALSEISGSMPVTAYVGFLFRVAATRLTVDIRQSMNANCAYIGNYKDGTWYWDQLALKSDITNNYRDYDSNGNYHVRVSQLDKMVIVSGEVFGKGTEGYITDIALPTPFGYDGGSELMANAIIFYARNQSTGAIQQMRTGADHYIYREAAMTNGQAYSFAFSYCRKT